MKWNFPENLQYSREHEWAEIKEENIVIVGVTDYAQDKLGEVVFVELPETDQEVKAEESMAVIESVKAASDVYAPVSGKVIAVNEKLLDQPELLNEDPYKAGWIARIKISDEGELEALLSKEEYVQLVEQEES
ncbi:MAG: glycine cleavage system protein GcvH [Firmicutes bacterium]|nr:glycine cleavage system protein GcvH [Bacillota bacterium]